MIAQWSVMPNLPRCVLTHEGHTVMFLTAADARFAVESANDLIGKLNNKEKLREEVR